ncbi:MAG: N-acetylmuramoyl-L-alanine amidase [Bacteroidota bacterium]|nr:N-acetylmuramoyl-L-alanine amidase [Bacteroidota bacterium]MDP4194954.1 N-acetylmuramoyl-L-alanine amidase [Bacteroidota bacterium]
MKVKFLIALFFISAFTLYAQRRSEIRVSLDGNLKNISSISRNGVGFVSCRQLSEMLGASIYFNPANSKLEIKFAKGILKLTAQNEFAVYTSKINNIPEVLQIPIAPVLIHNDLYVPLNLYSDIFSKASGHSLLPDLSGGTKNSKEVLAKSDEIAKEKTKVNLGNNTNQEKPIKRISPPSVKKTDLSQNPVASGPTIESKSNESKSKSSNGASKTKNKTDVKIKSEAKSTEDIKVDDAKVADNAEAKKSLSRFDIAGVTIETKSNGTLIRLLCKKRVTRYSASVNNKILYINLLGVKVDEKMINSSEARGLVKKIQAKNIAPNSQIEFYLKDGYSTYETFQDSPGHDLLITIHNKLLSSRSSQTGSSGNNNMKKWALKTVVIDAGHGGKDPGAIGINGVKEKDVNLAIAMKLGEMIQDNMPDVKVVYTRSSDKFVELYKRGKIANEKNGNLFVSIHCNSTPSKPTSANGFEIYLLKPGRTKEAISIAERENSVIQYEDNPSHYQKLTDENFILVSMAHSSFMRYSERFSDILNKNFTTNCSLESNGIKQAGFYVLVGASMPSVLVETGFISNKNDEAYLASKAGQKNIASAIFKSVESFKEEYDRNIQMEMESAVK